MRSNKTNRRNHELESSDYVVEVNFVEIPEAEQSERAKKIVYILVDNAIKMIRNKLVP